jgi:hypothetical protein
MEEAMSDYRRDLRVNRVLFVALVLLIAAYVVVTVGVATLWFQTH